MAGHAACEGVDGELHASALLDEPLGQFHDLKLRLGQRHAVTGDDDDALRGPDCRQALRFRVLLHRAGRLGGRGDRFRFARSGRRPGGSGGGGKSTATNPGGLNAGENAEQTAIHARAHDVRQNRP